MLAAEAAPRDRRGPSTAADRPAPESSVPATPPLDAPAATLDAELSARVDPQAQRSWTNLMKGEAVFRGVPMGGVRAPVRRIATVRLRAGPYRRR